MLERLIPIAAILGCAILYALYQSWVYRDKDDKGPELSGPATIKSHQVIQGRYLGKAPSRWNYMITFTLSDGEEIELYVTDDVFHSLKEGQSGLLTWQGKRFYHFEPDM